MGPWTGPAARSAVPGKAASGRLGAGEAAVIITVVAAVTLLAVLERPIPTVLTLLAGAVIVLLAGRRAGRLLAAIAALTASGVRG